MNMKIYRRTIEAIVSAVSAIICMMFAGCRLAFSDFKVSNFEAEVFSTNSMFHVEH